VVRLAFTAVLVAATIAALPAPARAQEPVNADALPQLWEPEQAVAYLLTGRPTASAEAEAARWDGGLPGGVSRALFGAYHLVLSSQDSANCVFSPSCSRFSQKAIGSCGFLEGALLTLDRLLRDHPLAVPFYPRAEGGRLLQDEPARYCLTRSP
jgi:hypothetical protein